MKGTDICKDNTKCTGCYACMNVCPKDAISFTEDKYGFVKPHVILDKCIDCKLCQKLCPANKTELEDFTIHPTAIFKDDNSLYYSQASSGGAFGVLARYVLSNNGVVFGCEMDSSYLVRHIKIDSINELYKLHGSKYVQSDIGYIYRTCKKELENKRLVLFSGCPCQIDGLKSFLKKDYNNLITIDLICHGVPNQKLFKEFIHWFFKQEKNKGYKYYTFRHKSTLNKNDNTIYDAFHNDDFFIKFYLWGLLYRESCYHCKYAGKQRVADFTIGDFWENFKINLNIDPNSSYSKIIFNTNKAINYKSLFEENGTYFELNPAQIQQTNRGPLKEPSPKGLRRKIIYTAYRFGGVKAVNVFYQLNKTFLRLLP